MTFGDRSKAARIWRYKLRSSRRSRMIFGVGAVMRCLLGAGAEGSAG
jgi:hypothetical protein